MAMATELGLQIGQRIKRARQHKAWTQPMLAEKLGVSAVAVSAWETGVSVPRLNMRPKLWQLLDLTPDDFDFDPPPDGGGRRHQPRPTTTSAEANAAPQEDATIDLVAALAELARNTVIGMEGVVPLEMQRDILAKAYAGIRQLEEAGDVDHAKRMRDMLANTEGRAGYIVTNVAIGVIVELVKLLVDRLRAKATETTADESATGNVDADSDAGEAYTIKATA